MNFKDKSTQVSYPYWKEMIWELMCARSKQDKEQVTTAYGYCGK